MSTFGVRRSTFGVRVRSRFAVHRSPFTVHRSPFAAQEQCKQTLLKNAPTPPRPHALTPSRSPKVRWDGV
jgi:hypothetical protein